MTKEDIEKYNHHYDLANDLAMQVIILDNSVVDMNDETIAIAKKAIAHYEICLQISNQWAVRFFLGKIYQWLGEDHDALHHYLNGMDLERENADLANEASMSAMKINDIELALELSFEANRRSPNNSKFISNHALNLLINKEDEKALEWSAKAVELNNTDPINIRVHNLINAVVNGKKKRPTFKDCF